MGRGDLGSRRRHVRNLGREQLLYPRGGQHFIKGTLTVHFIVCVGRDINKCKSVVYDNINKQII